MEKENETNTGWFLKEATDCAEELKQRIEKEEDALRGFTLIATETPKGEGKSTSTLVYCSGVQKEIIRGLANAMLESEASDFFKEALAMKLLKEIAKQ